MKNQGEQEHWLQMCPTFYEHLSKFKNVTQINVNVEFVRYFDVENSPVEAQINHGSLWTFIMLTSYPDGWTAQIKFPW